MPGRRYPKQHESTLVAAYNRRNWRGGLDGQSSVPRPVVEPLVLHQLPSSEGVSIPESLRVTDISVDAFGDVLSSTELYVDTSSSGPTILAVDDDRVLVCANMVVYRYEYLASYALVPGATFFFLYDISTDRPQLLSKTSIPIPYNTGTSYNNFQGGGAEYGQSWMYRVSDTDFVAVASAYAYEPDNTIADSVFLPPDHLDATPVGAVQFPGMLITGRVRVSGDSLSVVWSTTVGLADNAAGHDYRYGGGWNVYGGDLVGSLWGGGSGGSYVHMLARLDLATGAFSRVVVPTTSSAQGIGTGDRCFWLTGAGKVVWVSIEPTNYDWSSDGGVQRVIDLSTGAIEATHDLDPAEATADWGQTVSRGYPWWDGLTVTRGDTAYAYAELEPLADTYVPQVWMYEWNGSKLVKSGTLDVSVPGGAGTMWDYSHQSGLPESTWAEWGVESNYYLDDRHYGRFLAWDESSGGLIYATSLHGQSPLWGGTEYPGYSAPAALRVGGGWLTPSPAEYLNSMVKSWGVGFEPWMLGVDVTPSGSRVAMVAHGLQDDTQPDRELNYTASYRTNLVVFPT